MACLRRMCPWPLVSPHLLLRLQTAEAGPNSRRSSAGRESEAFGLTCQPMSTRRLRVDFQAMIFAYRGQLPRSVAVPQWQLVAKDSNTGESAFTCPKLHVVVLKNGVDLFLAHLSVLHTVQEKKTPGALRQIDHLVNLVASCRSQRSSKAALASKDLRQLAAGCT